MVAKKKRKKNAKQGKAQPSFALGAIGGGVLAAVAFAVLFFAGDDRGAQETPTPAPAPTRAASRPSLPPPPPDFSHAELDSARRISAEETVDLVAAGAALIVDVRDVQSYGAGHIPGSLQIPLGFIESQLQWFPPDRQLIFYCT